jgi:predicted PurR-regulated permease PerM|tara:strand:+ start:58 stop:1089 length:1032 start_codon:yes stop_codon:yes gene_type:complete
MSVSSQEIRRVFVLSLIILLVVLSFMVIKPIILSIITGLILAYAFYPLYKKFYSILREKNTSALAVCALILLVIFIPLWFLIPSIVQQTFDMYAEVQDIDLVGLVEKIFPASSQQFQKDFTVNLYRFTGNITSDIINILQNFLRDLPTVLLHGAVIVFVFFFTLRDGDKLKEFIKGISPFKKTQEKILVKKFKEITSSVVFGYIIVGVIQGIATGLGLILFGVPHALMLTFLAIFASILPMVGPWFVWIPATLYLFISGRTGAAIGFILYSALFVSSIDNILRPYIVARKTGTSSVIVLIGMIGGLFLFGILGIILGPLILSYLILFLKAYKDKTLSDMFSTN